MKASNRRNAALLWTGIGAATAGIIAVVTILKVREQAENDKALRDRDLNAVLEDCYRKISEIEEHLPKPTVTAATRPRRTSTENSLANN